VILKACSKAAEQMCSFGRFPALRDRHWGKLNNGREEKPETVFLNVYGAQESIPRNNSASLCSLADWYDNPIPTRFLAPIDGLKIPALNRNSDASYATVFRISKCFHRSKQNFIRFFLFNKAA
jgi:hypothetical protein